MGRRRLFTFSVGALGGISALDIDDVIAFLNTLTDADAQPAR